MKSLLFLCVFATSFFVSSASLIDALKAAHQSPSFRTLSHHDQLLVIELIAETEAGELKSYIDSVGFHNVLAVIDKLPAAEAHVLTTYLMNVVGKRQSSNLVQVLKAAKENPAFQNLTDTDQQLIIKMLTAAENNQLTILIDQLGYSTVLRIIDILPDAEKHLFEQYLIQHLHDESSPIG